MWKGRGIGGRTPLYAAVLGAAFRAQIQALPGALPTRSTTRPYARHGWNCLISESFSIDDRDCDAARSCANVSACASEAESSDSVDDSVDTRGVEGPTHPRMKQQ